MKKNEILNRSTGEIRVLTPEDLNKVIIIETKRKKGNLRIQQDFSNCPTLAEQHTAHLSDPNYLIERFRPDELAAYIAARSSYRQEILGYDLSTEPTLQDAMNAAYAAKQMFEGLDENVRNQFRSPVEFLKFIDNPENAEKMVNMGILKKKQIEEITPKPAPVPGAGGDPSPDA